MDDRVKLTFDQFYDLFIDNCTDQYFDHTGNYLLSNVKFKFPIFNKLYVARIVMNEYGFGINDSEYFSFSKDLDKKLLLLL